MTKSTLTYVMVCLTACFLAACEITESVPGPQGPPGRDGNANVFSIAYDVREGDWKDFGVEGEPGFYRYLDLTVPEVNQQIVNSGLVLAYFRERDKDPWIALPYTFISHDPSFTETFDFVYGLGFVSLKSAASDRGATRYNGTVRVIVAEAVPVAKRAIDFSNYQEVIELFGLKE